MSIPHRNPFRWLIIYKSTISFSLTMLYSPYISPQCSPLFLHNFHGHVYSFIIEKLPKAVPYGFNLSQHNVRETPMFMHLPSKIEFHFLITQKLSTNKVNHLVTVKEQPYYLGASTFRTLQSYNFTTGNFIHLGSTQAHIHSSRSKPSNIKFKFTFPYNKLARNKV